MSTDEYREEFGIPWRRTLISPTLRTKQAAIMNQQKAEGILPHAPSPEHIARLITAAQNRRVSPASVTDVWVRHALSTHGQTERLSHKDFEEFLRRVSTGRTITEVGRDPDMMRRETFDTYCRRNPDFMRKVEDVLDGLPPAVQVRGQRVGKSLKRFIVILRELHQMSWPEIGFMLDMVEGTPRNIYHRLKHAGKLEEFR